MSSTPSPDARTYGVSPSADPSILTPVDEHEDLREVARAILAKSDDTWDSLMSDLEIGTLAVPEARGGAGFGMREVGVVLEETGAALLSEPVLTSAVVAVQALLSAPGAGEALLAGIASGRETATVAGAGPVDMRATTTDGLWLLDGSVTRVPHVGSADHLFVPASTDHGTGLFAVDLHQDTVSRESRRVLDETRPVGDVTLTRTSATALLAPDDFAQGWATITTVAAIGVAAEHTGMAAHLLEMTTTYLRQREQFGRPIASFQAIKHRLADLLVDVERARSASRYAAAIFDREPGEAAVAARVAAAVCQDVVIRAAHEAVQLHGGIGFTWEHPAHLYVRRALGDEGLFGSSRAHRSAVADLVGL